MEGKPGRKWNTRDNLAHWPISEGSVWSTADLRGLQRDTTAEQEMNVVLTDPNKQLALNKSTSSGQELRSH
jgi:hypothetical protein